VTDLGLVAVLAAGLVECGFMVWHRLLSFRSNGRTAPPAALRRAFALLKFGGGLVGILALAAVLVETSPRLFGIDPADPTSFGPEALALGLGLGVVLYLFTELLIPAVNFLGFSYEPGYGEITPSSPSGWLVFLGVELPVISLREELIYRVALIGVAAALFGLSPLLLAAVSTAVFGGIHFTGDGGVVIAAILGGCLAIAFVLTNSLLAVVVAHTIVNGAEFIVHDGLDADPGRRLFGSLG
jgi:membrane protease YdiL (CAAX protease family)